MAEQLQRRTSRRTVVKSAAASAFAAPAFLRLKSASAQGTPDAADAGFNWRQFEGETITTLLATSSRADVLVELQPQFEELTGITVNVDVVPEQQQRQKMVIEFTSGNPSFDVAMVSWHVQKGLFGRGQFMLDLRELLDDPELTAPSYDFADFSEAALRFATQADGRIDTLPFNIDYWITYWNMELFDQAGVAFPETLEETVAAAEALHDPDNGVFGFVARGLKNANVPVWTSFMQGWGAKPVTDDGALETTTEAAVAAAGFYQTLLANYAPPGVSGFNWNECQTTFSQGTAAIWFDGIGFAAPLENPDESLVVGKVGYGLQPAGPDARHAGTFGDGIGITANSAKPGPAYLYSQWATGVEVMQRILELGAGAPPRNSIYADEEFLATVEIPQGWVEALVASGEIGLPSLPEIIPVTEFRDIFGIALTNMITGADPAAELELATQQFQPILEQSLAGS
ncbi:MAG: extracellular solute-binding protein [Chloroflexia bacterium]|nr:extracellular solute-binding protein [Chloroflexia bacterium]MDQ3412642.1 extracellular solute-binding protein [Chloroflexota bacterium]